MCTIRIRHVQPVWQWGPTLLCGHISCRWQWQGDAAALLGCSARGIRHATYVPVAGLLLLAGEWLASHDSWWAAANQAEWLWGQEREWGSQQYAGDMTGEIECKVRGPFVAVQHSTCWGLHWDNYVNEQGHGPD